MIYSCIRQSRKAASTCDSARKYGWFPMTCGGGGGGMLFLFCTTRSTTTLRKEGGSGRIFQTVQSLYRWYFELCRSVAPRSPRQHPIRAMPNATVTRILAKRLTLTFVGAAFLPVTTGIPAGWMEEQRQGEAETYSRTREGGCGAISTAAGLCLSCFGL